jgi:Lrp/AsnC family leucine-responsive transcriptional regulator
LPRFKDRLDNPAALLNLQDRLWRDHNQANCVCFLASGYGFNFSKRKRAPIQNQWDRGDRQFHDFDPMRLYPDRTAWLLGLVWLRKLNPLSSADMTKDSTAFGSSYLMDSFGRSLLKELQDNSRLSIAELARRVGLSATATAERIKQMEEAGIVRSYTIEMDREALGLEVLAFIRMTCDGQHYFRLMEFVQTLEEVRECHHLTGGDAFLLKVTTSSMESLEALIEALLPFGNPVTSVVLSTPVERRKFSVTLESKGKIPSSARKRGTWGSLR